MSFCRSAIGLMVCSFGIRLMLAADIGLSPWETLNDGLSNAMHISYGAACIGTAVMVVSVDLFLKERLGVSTILDACLVGVVVDLFQRLFVFPTTMNLLTKISLLIFGMLVTSLGQTIYMSAGLGYGPRDMLLVALTKRAQRLSLGAVSCILLGCVLFIGILLGAQIGVGTIIATFGSGWFLQIVSGLAGIDLCTVKQESIAESIARWKNI